LGVGGTAPKRLFVETTANPRDNMFPAARGGNKTHIKTPIEYHEVPPKTGRGHDSHVGSRE